MADTWPRPGELAANGAKQSLQLPSVLPDADEIERWAGLDLTPAQASVRFYACADALRAAQARCLDCDGHGTDPADCHSECPMCGGSGVLPSAEPSYTEVDRLTAALRGAGVLDDNRPAAKAPKRTGDRITWDCSRTEALLLAAVLEDAGKAARAADDAEGGALDALDAYVEAVRANMDHAHFGISTSS